MNLGQRLLYYLGGFGIGIILLFFFLGGKNTSCDYGPNSRVLKNIRIKKRQIDPTVSEQLHSFQLDTSAISEILSSGNVDFSKSNTKLDSCKTYVIQGKVKTKTLELFVENCDSTAIFKRLVKL